jgi:hypothetical protein
MRQTKGNAIITVCELKLNPVQFTLITSNVTDITENDAVKHAEQLAIPDMIIWVSFEWSTSRRDYSSEVFYNPKYKDSEPEITR